MLVIVAVEFGRVLTGFSWRGRLVEPLVGEGKVTLPSSKKTGLGKRLSKDQIEELLEFTGRDDGVDDEGVGEFVGEVEEDDRGSLGGSEEEEVERRDEDFLTLTKLGKVRLLLGFV